MISKKIMNVLVFSSILTSLQGECKFPNPCGQMLKQHESIASSSKIKQQTESYSENSLDWAWEKLFHQITFGGKRLNTEIPDGIPVGDVFLNTEGLQVNTTVRITSFELFNQQKRIWVLNAPKTSFIIPSNILKQGSEYTWEATIQDGVDIYTLKDDFSLMSAMDQKKIQSEHQKIMSATNDSTGSEFLFAVFCYDSGYQYNGDIIIQNLRKGYAK